MINADKVRWLMIFLMILVCLVAGTIKFTVFAEAGEVAYCKHGQTGEVIVIEANMACPFGYYRI